MQLLVVGRLRNMDLVGIRLSFWGPEVNHESISQDCRSPGQDSSPGPRHCRPQPVIGALRLVSVWLVSVVYRLYKMIANRRFVGLSKCIASKIINSCVAGNNTYKKFWRENLLVCQKSSYWVCTKTYQNRSQPEADRKQLWGQDHVTVTLHAHRNSVRRCLYCTDHVATCIRSEPNLTLPKWKDAINSMQQGPSWEADSHSSSQYIVFQVVSSFQTSRTKFRMPFQSSRCVLHAVPILLSLI
jgi:hypothetical protein